MKSSTGSRYSPDGRRVAPTDNVFRGLFLADFYSLLTETPKRADNRSVDRPNTREAELVGVEPKTRAAILSAAKQCLLEIGYARLSTRRIAVAAGVPLSQIHYHFGSKQNLVLEVLAEENRRLLDRQTDMYNQDMPLWKRWEQACDFLDDDLESGYVRVLQEMMAAGWSDEEIAASVRANLMGWFELLTTVASSAFDRFPGLDEAFSAEELAILTSVAFLGAEAIILLGVEEAVAPTRAALRKVGALIRRFEEGDAS